jgi:ribosomal protein S18 acetylase RimI-like enzyme
MARRSGIVIRPYRPEDEAQVIVIARHLQAHESAYFDRLIPPSGIGADYVARLQADVADHQGHFIVAETDGVIAGYCTLLMLDSADERDEVFYTFAHVGDLAVHENHRNRGVGQALLDESEAVARRHGKKWLRLGVLADNAGARRFYERHGMRVGFMTMEKKLG